MSNHYDFIVLGGGSAGYAAARTAVDHGAKVAVVDGGKELGGLCILRGCMPSKTLIYSAEVLHLAQAGSLFGLTIPEAKADMKAIQARKKRTIQEFSEYRQQQLKAGQFDLYALSQLKTLRKEVFDPRIADTPENERIMVLDAKPKPMTMEASYVRTE